MMLTTNGRAIARMFRSAIPKAFTNSNIKTLRIGTNLVHANVVSFTPVGASKGAGLAASIQQRVDTQTMTGFVFTPKSYAEAVEFGTAPHMPPVAPLERWGRVVLGKSGLGWPLAMAIKRRGTRGFGMFTRGRQASAMPLETLTRRGIEAFVREQNVALSNKN